MTISVAQAGILPATSGYSGNMGSPSTAGNSLFLVISAFSTANVILSSSAPTLGGSPVTGATKLASIQSAFAGGFTVLQDIWLLPNIPGGQSALAITVTNEANSANLGIGYVEVAGLGSSPSVDQSSTGTASSTTYDSGTTLTTTHPSEIWISGAVAGNGISAPSAGGWTNQTLPAAVVSYQIASSTGTARLTGTAVNGEWAAAVATIPGAAAPVTSPGGWPGDLITDFILENWW